MTTVMRRQRLTRRANCTTLALRSSLGSILGSTLGSRSGGITSGGATRSVRSSTGSARVLASDAAIESDTASGSSPTGGGMEIESLPSSSAMISGGDSAGGVSGGGAGGVSTGGSGAANMGAAGGASLAGSTMPSSALILSQSSGGGSTASTMTLSSPSRRSHIRTDAAKPGSSVSNASACSRSSAESVPSTYSAASASWASSYLTALVPSSCGHRPIPSRTSSRLRRNHVLIVFTGISSLVESCSRLQPL